jgi:hypothetical protein
MVVRDLHGNDIKAVESGALASLLGSIEYLCDKHLASSVELIEISSLKDNPSDCALGKDSDHVLTFYCQCAHGFGDEMSATCIMYVLQIRGQGA